MGANRGTYPSSAPSSSSSTLWNVSTPATLACVARATGVVDLYALPSGRRVSATALRIDHTNGRPTALSVRPPTNPSTHAAVAIGTSGGAVYLDETVVAQMQAAISAISYGVDAIVVVDSSNAVLTIHPGKRTILSRFSLTHAHAVPISRVLCVSAEQVIFASQVVTVGSANSDNDDQYTTVRKSKKIGQHQTPVTTLSTLHAANVVLSACDSEPYICAWRLGDHDEQTHDQDAEKFPANAKRRRSSSAPASSKAPSSAAATLVAPTAGIVRLSTDETSGAIAALLRNGNVAVWRQGALDRTGSGRNPSTTPTPVAPAFVVRASRMSGQVFIAAFPKRARLAVLHGAPLKPTVHTFPVDGEQANGNNDSDVILPAVDTDVFIDREAFEKKGEGSKTNGIFGTKQAELLVSDVAPTQARVNDKDAGIAKKRKQNGRMEGVEGEGEAQDDDDSDSGENSPERESDQNDDDGDDDDAEPSLQEKLATLGISRSENSRTKQPGKGNKSGPVEVTNMNSRVSVLLQAVRSNDSQLLTSCLKVRDETVVKSTVALVPAAIASGPLLEILVHRLKIQERFAAVLSLWIRAILTEHAAAIAARDQNRALTALVAVISNRTKSLDALTRLHGRLQLVSAQAEKMRHHMVSLNEMKAKREYIEELEEEDDEDEDDEIDKEEEEEDDPDGSSGVESEDENDVEDNDNEDGDEENDGDEDDSGEADENGDGDVIEQKDVEMGKADDKVVRKDRRHAETNGKMDVDKGDDEDSDESDSDEND